RKNFANAKKFVGTQDPLKTSFRVFRGSILLLLNLHDPRYPRRSAVRMSDNLVLIGSGLAGGLLAAFLGRRGYQVQLYERRPDPRADNFVGGRFIHFGPCNPRI